MLALIGFFQSGGGDPRIGSWALVSAQSSLDAPNRLTITPVQDGMHAVMTGQTHLDFMANSNGKQAPAPGNLGFNQIELHRASKKQADVREKKDGVLVATVREKLSNDGDELTSTTMVAGKPDQISVWVRTGGAKAPKDPFSGEWTQDMGKTAMRQGGVLKIEPDGRGGTRFTSAYSYDGRFDGKPYDLKNSRDDSVSLALVDPHTVEETYRRDNQVSQKDRWQVSADGQLLTMSAAGTLETGQKLTEKLVFKKQ